MAWVGGDLKDHIAPNHCLGQEHHSVSPGPTEPGPEHLLGWATPCFSGQPVPVPHHSHSEDFFPNIPILSV